MYVVRKLVSCFFYVNHGCSTLHHFIDWNEPHKIKRALKLHLADINGYSNGITPIYRSVLDNKPECTIALLEHHPKPDLELPGKKDYSRGKTPLSSAIAADKLNTARLLIMHGALTKNIVIPSHQKTAIETALKDHRNYKILMQQAKDYLNQGQYEQAIECYTQAKTIWQRLAEQETIPAYKQHYLRKVAKIDKKMTKCASYDERQPLLVSKKAVY